MPVASFGRPLPAEEWSTLARKTGRPVVIDAAAPLWHQGIAENLLIAVSLHAAKPLGTGEGGLVAFRDPHSIARTRNAINFGFEGDMVVSGGFNGKLNEMAAAVGVLQLAHRVEVRRRRYAIWKTYRAALATLPGVAGSRGMTDGSGRARGADGESGRGRKHHTVHRRGHSVVALVCAATARPSTVCGKRSITRCDVCSSGDPPFAGCAA